jgi:integrase
MPLLLHLTATGCATLNPPSVRQKRLYVSADPAAPGIPSLQRSHQGAPSVCWGSSLPHGHCLRAGLATAAAAAGVAYHAIKKQTGHRSDQVLQRSIRDGSLFRESAAAKVGL